TFGSVKPWALSAIRRAWSRLSRMSEDRRRPVLDSGQMSSGYALHSFHEGRHLVGSPAGALEGPGQDLLDARLVQRKRFVGGQPPEQVGLAAPVTLAGGRDRVTADDLMCFLAAHPATDGLHEQTRGGEERQLGGQFGFDHLREESDLAEDGEERL